MPLTNGTKLGPYEIVAPLGSGGMGEVYRARDSKLGRDVAVKVLSEALASDAGRLARFEREARVLASLNHPNIATLYGLEKADGRDLLVMELVEGSTLGDLMPKEGFPLARFLQIAIPLAEAVTAAHQSGVVHRDLKPANVMIEASGRVKVLDFGLAKTTPPASIDGEASLLPTRPAGGRPLTEEGAVLGTLEYMSPEQACGGKTDQRSDVFSLGVIFYEMVSGDRPFTGSTRPEVFAALLRESPRNLDDLRPDVPRLLSRLVARCLEKDPERRIQTCKDVRNELEEFRRLSEEGGGRLWGDRRCANPGPEERHFTLTTDLLRTLSERSPRLLGRPMTYLDNRVPSSDLVVLVHGLGGDQRQFEAALPAIPARAVAPTLVGFEPEATSRPPLGLEDDSRILRAFLKDLASRLRPARTVLLGFSAGADQCLRLAASEEGPGIPLAGLIALGPNIDLSTCFFTSRLANLSMNDSGAILETLKDLGRDMGSLEDWLTLQQYTAACFTKLDGQLEVLKRYCAEIAAPFQAGGDPLADWYRVVSERVAYVRMVFGGGSEAASAEALLARHLQQNVLGDRFTETSCVFEPMHHMKLGDSDVVIRHVQEGLKAIGAGGGNRVHGRGDPKTPFTRL